MSRPKDPRMWNAMGNCYDKMEKKMSQLSAIKGQKSERIKKE